MRVAVVLGLLLLIACTPPVTTSDTVELLKQACNTCDAASTVTVPLGTESRLYTTEDAICIRKGNQLSCGTCGCPIVAAELQTGPVNLTCTFAPGDILAISCI